jgi:hypothetical protein
MDEKAERHAVLMVWPEIFRIIFIQRRETSWKTSADLTEDALRVELRKLGHTKLETNRLIQRARDYPV